jgi:hypothetical protein
MLGMDLWSEAEQSGLLSYPVLLTVGDHLLNPSNLFGRITFTRRKLAQLCRRNVSLFTLFHVISS